MHGGVLLMRLCRKDPRESVETINFRQFVRILARFKRTPKSQQHEMNTEEKKVDCESYMHACSTCIKKDCMIIRNVDINDNWHTCTVFYACMLASCTCIVCSCFCQSSTNIFFVGEAA